jgi:hypothetical protein
MEPLLALGRFGLQVGELGLMNPGISLRFGTRETHKRSPHLGAMASIYVLPEHLEQ